ncbi:MAG: hypothetical protein IPG04_25050 [Polyangiaceae bacterium]|nr:hypothetical protein [Polyangiaceae bacterium]
MRVSLFSLVAALSMACDPPCEPYWKLRCDSCGPTSPACEHAKQASKNELSDGGQCKKMVALAESEGELTRKRYCALHENGERSLDELRGPWRCGATKIEFRGPATESKQSADPQQIVVDGVATKIWNVRTSTFQIEGAPACNYWLMPHEESDGDVGLALSCAHAVGGLPSHMLRCVK